MSAFEKSFEQSRSVQRRIAEQTGQPPPTFPIPDLSDRLHGAKPEEIDSDLWVRSSSPAVLFDSLPAYDSEAGRVSPKVGKAAGAAPQTPTPAPTHETIRPEAGNIRDNRPVQQD